MKIHLILIILIILVNFNFIFYCIKYHLFKQALKVIDDLSLTIIKVKAFSDFHDFGDFNYFICFF
jgi:hypothetical protein